MVRMLKRGRRFFHKTICRSSSGATLVEVTIAIIVLALITASVPPVLLALNKAEFKWTERTIAESLIRTQVEFIKGYTYIPGNETVPNPSYPVVPVPDDSYEIAIEVVPVRVIPVPTPVPTPAPTPGHVPVNFALGEEDEGIQEITVSIYHVDKLVMETKNYKVDR